MNESHYLPSHYNNYLTLAVKIKIQIFLFERFLKNPIRFSRLHITQLLQSQIKIESRLYNPIFLNWAKPAQKIEKTSTSGATFTGDPSLLY